MKVVHALGWYYPDSLGGTEAYVAGLVRRLRAAGVETAVAAPRVSREGAAAEPREEEVEGARVFRYPLAPDPTREECQTRLAARGSEHLHRWLAREAPDIFHVHTLQVGLGVYELEAARAAGARVVVTNHLGSLGYICQRGTLMRWGEFLCDGLLEIGKCAACELQHRGMSRPLARSVAALPPAVSARLGRVPGAAGTMLGMSDLIAHNRDLQNRVLRLTDRFVLLNRWALDALERNGAPREKLALNRLGYSHENAERKPPPEERPTRSPVRVGYLGRLVNLKGVEDLVRAVASLDREVPLTLELRGPVQSPEAREMVARLKRRVGDDPRLRFAPPVSPEEVPEVLAGYDVLCCPSVWFENGPTVVMEAHAVGTPVIGTRIGAMAEVITDGVNGRLLTPGDWEGLAAALGEVARDPAGTVDAWRRRLPPARSMDEIARDYLRLYQEVLRPASGASGAGESPRPEEAARGDAGR